MLQTSPKWEKFWYPVMSCDSSPTCCIAGRRTRLLPACQIRFKSRSNGSFFLESRDWISTSSPWLRLPSLDSSAKQELDVRVKRVAKAGRKSESWLSRLSKWSFPCHFAMNSDLFQGQGKPSFSAKIPRTHLFILDGDLIGYGGWGVPKPLVQAYATCYDRTLAVRMFTLGRLGCVQTKASSRGEAHSHHEWQTEDCPDGHT